jgi:benzoate-CoA ligase
MTSQLIEPGPYNAAQDLIDRNLRAGRGNKTAFIDDRGTCSYDALASRVDRCGNTLIGLGLHQEQRILLCLVDSIDFPTCFLGAIKAGIVPVPVNTMLTASDYAFMIGDSRARAIIVSAPLLPTIEAALATLPAPHPIVIVAGEPPAGSSTDEARHRSLDALLDAAPPEPVDTLTHSDEPCFWLYSSGSTGRPKGTVHRHSSLINTANLYAVPILGIAEQDVVFSAAKLFFAYGLGNGLTFPMAVGATTVLMAERATPAGVCRVLRQHRPSIFYGVPTLYGALLASPDLPAKPDLALRRCTSAGEPLPQDIGKRWSERTGCDILDGIGSTEMLHIFLSNRTGEVCYGTTGIEVPGYELKIVDEHGTIVPRGEIGDLLVRGPTSASFYWNNRTRSCGTFQGDWTRTGDKYCQDEQGRYVYAGRSDDMLKVGGIYVSPAEVESALIAHESVLEAAVIGAPDESDLIKPKAYVVLKQGFVGDKQLDSTLKQHVKTLLAPYKYPRWIEFVDELPKTATGKIQRFKLRAQTETEQATPKPG